MRWRIVASNSLTVAVRDRNPVTPLHSLVLTRRHAATFFGLFEPERRAINLLLAALRREIIEMDNSVAQGGIRAVIPGKANY